MNDSFSPELIGRIQALDKWHLPPYDDEKHKRLLAEVNAKLDALLEHFGIEYNGPDFESE